VQVAARPKFRESPTAEHEAGVVREGLRADLTVLAADPVDVPAQELPAVPVIHTVVDGDLYRW
jgi:predicted amidohydrolase YtcJ